MPELVRLEAALAGVRRHLQDRAGSRALQSAVEQLEYLVAHARGENDGAALARINVGVIAMREIEDGDLDLAMTLYAIEREAHRIAGQSGNA